MTELRIPFELTPTPKQLRLSQTPELDTDVLRQQLADNERDHRYLQGLLHVAARREREITKGRAGR